MRLARRVNVMDIIAQMIRLTLAGVVLERHTNVKVVLRRAKRGNRDVVQANVDSVANFSQQHRHRGFNAKVNGSHTSK